MNLRYRSTILINLLFMASCLTATHAGAQSDSVAPETPLNQKANNKTLTESEFHYFQAKNVLTDKCLGCHGLNSTTTDFSPFIADEKMWVSANLIVPKRPQDSVLYRYLQGSGYSPEPFGSMPQGGSLSADELSIFKRWIENMPDYFNTSSVDQQARHTLKIYCARCHGAASEGLGGINYIESADKLVANGKIIPRSPAERSILYGRITSSSNPMPASGPKPTDAEIANLKLWIESVVPPPSAISEEAVFHRCYGQMVRKRAPADHPLLARVKSKSMSAQDACMALFDKAKLVNASGGIRLSDVNDVESKSILKTFHTFHQTWWLEDVKFPDNIYANLNHQMADDGHVNFLTNALFGPDTRYDSIVKEKRSLRARRNQGNWQINLSGSNYATSYEIEQGELSGFDFYPEGNGSWWDLQGVEQKTVKFSDTTSTPFVSKRNFGGGIIGLQSFIWSFSGYPFMRDRSNGAVRVPRRWSKVIYQTLMCRDIPLLRKTDVTAQVAEYLNRYPNPVDHVPFRPDGTCMSCHAALDPMAALLRNITFRRTDIPRAGAEAERQAHIGMAGGLATSAVEKLGFHLLQADASFYQRPPNGKLFYRGYDGALIDESISATSAEEALTKLGQSIATKDDFYMCAASRYFHFLTGIQVNLLDYMDPRNGGTISEGDLHYRDLLKKYALGGNGKPGLKDHQSLRTLISDIIASPLYRSEGMRDEK